MIEAALEGPVGRITLDRPEAHNALDRAAMGELTALLGDWAGRDDLRTSLGQAPFYLALTAGLAVGRGRKAGPQPVELRPVH